MASKRNRPNNSPPAKDGKKKKDSEVLYPCVTCGKEVESECIECEWCYNWEHKDCVGLSNDVYKALDGAPANVMFFCTNCESKVKLALKFFVDIQQKQQALDDKLEKKLESVETALTKAIESQIKTFAAQSQTAISDLASKVDGIAKDVSTNSTVLATKLSGQHFTLTPEETSTGSMLSMDTASSSITESLPSNNTNQLLASKSVDISNALSSALAEEKERSKRQLNLIIHNLDEAASDDAQTRKDQDTQKVSEIFKHLGTKASVNNAIRLGKKGDKKRLLKVTVSSDKEKAAILRSCTHLRKESTPTQFSNVFITPDLTPQQQLQNKILRNKLAEMNQDGKLYRIKNGQIVRRET